ncbi:MAG: hypothetical protein PHV36_01230 [Elusimicrobiales bacterium]|nr:hypothetical protein [Elusimicrobiales bacterium]
MKTLALAALFLSAPVWSSGKKSPEAVIADSTGLADKMQADLAKEEEIREQEMESYWDAQPEAEPVVAGQLLAGLKKIPWPDPRPVPKEKYLERPEVRAGELTDEEADPLLAGTAKKEKESAEELEAARRASDMSRYGLWLENFGFFQRAINACESGRTSGAERVKVLESAQTFVKEDVPLFYLAETVDSSDRPLEGLEARVKILLPELYKRGEYIPDYRSMLWAERVGGRLAGGMSGVTEAEKRRYYKIIARVRKFDPRAPQTEAAGGAVLASAPVAGAAKDAKWEQFLRDLAGQCNKTISTLSFSSDPSRHKDTGDKVEQAIRKMLASFPPGWEKYPRARWAHGWFSGALDRAGKAQDPTGRAMEIFKALDKYEAGLGPAGE